MPRRFNQALRTDDSRYRMHNNCALAELFGA
jgi:hypothetical protein